MWHDADRRLAKAVQRFEEGDHAGARAMLRSLDRRGVISPRIDLYLGHCHLEDDQVPAALRRYRRSAALSPGSAAPWMGLGLCYGRLGHLDRAVKAFGEALERDPDLEEAHCNLAHCHALREDLARAELHAARALELDPTCPHVHRHLALAYLIAGRTDEALAAWLRVRALEPHHPELDVGLGRTLAAQGRRAEARAAFHRALAGPHAADAAYGLGDLARAEGRSSEAIAHYRSAVRREPDFVEARLRWAEAALDAGRVQRALEVLEPLLGEPAPEEEAVRLAATAERLSGRPGDGVARYRTRLQVEPDREAWWQGLVEHLLEADRPRGAARVARARLKACPGDVGTLRLYTRALGRSGRRREAVRRLAQAVHARPRDLELHLDLAAALLAAARDASAERALLRALSHLPEAPDIWTGLAELAFEAGRLEVALARTLAALRRDRRHPGALGILVRVHHARGVPRKAAGAGRAAQRVLPPDDEARRDHGRALLALGRTAPALIELRRYVLAAPQDPEGYLALADALDAIGDPDGARRQRHLARVVHRVAVPRRHGGAVGRAG
ncbi:MAG: tetratricopeptide repeat protein [Planctomycetes bacterium]|nr:tetratricopeptide repeat protein [Planctomycetota bacterium]